jgi:hypothetical protein
MIKKAHDVADGKADPANMLRAAEDLMKILGMTDRKKPQVHEIEGEFMSLSEIENTLQVEEPK